MPKQTIIQMAPSGAVNLHKDGKVYYFNSPQEAQDYYNKHWAGANISYYTPTDSEVIYANATNPEGDQAVDPQANPDTTAVVTNNRDTLEEAPFNWRFTLSDLSENLKNSWNRATNDFWENNPFFGQRRVDINRRAWERNPQAMQHWTDGGNAAAAFVTTPFIASAAGEYAIPWLSENIFPYLSAEGWLAATQAAGNTPAWLTPTSAAAIDATLAGTATGASINDMIENGPTVENVLGTTLGGIGLAYEAAPTIIDGYTAVRNALRPAIIGMKMRGMPLSKIQSTELPFNVGWGPRQTISVTHTSDQASPLLLYNEQRWDALNEGANPLGIWFQGKSGIPRTTNTGATPIARRPYTHSGDLTLDKPLVTIGDVPSRSVLSYQAEQMGADGLIYNNVYDNGYNLLSFRHPDNYLLTARAYKGGPRRSTDYEFFTTDPRYAHNFGQVKPYYIMSRFPVVTDTPLMGSKDISRMDALVNDIGRGRPMDAIIGHDRVTGEFPYTSQGDEILIFNPNQAKLIDESPRLSFQERQGIPKVERNFRTHGHDYSNPVDYGRVYQEGTINPESSRFGNFIDNGSGALVFQDPDNPNMVLKVNTNWRGPLQDFFDTYVIKRNRIPFQKPLIIRGRTQEGFPVFNQEKVIPMTDEQYIQNLPRMRDMLYQKGFLGDIVDWGKMSDGDITIEGFNPSNVAFDSKGNIVFIGIDAYKKGGKLNGKD